VCVRTLTELESCTLGAVWQRGPCTAYVIRREFAASITPYWSASAGSIYPVLRRLKKLRLVRTERTRWGRGKRDSYAITKAGVAALRRWIGPPISPAIAAPSFDPLRTRVSFLGVLPPVARKRFVGAAVKATQLALASATTFAAHVHDVYERAAVCAAIDELETRLRWLESAHLA
jgi:DNA-binding PadR family transcriptional regulator